MKKKTKSFYIRRKTEKLIRQDRFKYHGVMTSLCIGLIAAVFFYIQTEFRLNRIVEIIQKVACTEYLQESGREGGEGTAYGINWVQK